MKNPNYVLLVAALFAAPATGLLAQTGSPAPLLPSSSGANQGDEVLTLPEFNVTNNLTHNYIASESITGTRVASNLRELPFAVNVVTSEFLTDFAAFEFPEQVAYVSSFSPSEVQGQYQLRGIAATAQLVDGFRRLGLIDTVNIDRIEVIKGPAASIYGQVQPGGITNIITKRPKTRPEEGFTLQAGSNDFVRGEAYATGPAGGSGKLFYRVDLSDLSRSYEQAFKATSQFYGSFQLTYRIDADTSARFEFDHVFRHEHRGAQVGFIRLTVPDPFRLPDSKGVIRTYNSFAGLATADLFTFNYMGPEEYNDRRMTSGTVFLEHRINSVWSTRAAASAFRRDFKRLWVSGGNYSPTTRQFTGQLPEWDDEPQKALGAQIDTLAVFDTGNVSHKLLFTFDYSSQTDRKFDSRMGATNGANPAYNHLYNLSVDNPDYFFVTYQNNPAVYDNVTLNTWNTYDNPGLFISERASFFKDRVIAMLGGRYDWVFNRSADYTTPQSLSYNLHAFTHQAGLTVRVADPVTVYANDCNSFSPQPQFDQNGKPLPNEKGEGYEFGTKLALFNNHLNLTAAYYQIDRRNIVNNTTDPVTNAKLVVLSGHERSTGYEFDFNWQATDSLQFLGGYGYAKSKILENDELPFLVNSSPRRVPHDTLGLASRYEFKTAALRGLYATAGVKYYSRSIVNQGSGRSLTPSASNPIVNNPMANGTLPYPNQPVGAIITSGLPAKVTDGRESIFNMPYATADVGLGYRFKLGRRDQKIQFNVKNAFNRRYTYGSGIQGDPRQYLGTYSITF
jgi:outer membrane receptor protein involved in Fe transport